MPYGKYVNMEPATAPAQFPKSVVVSGNGKPLSTQSNGNGSTLQKIIDSGVPLTGGTSGLAVDSSAVNIGNAISSLGNNLKTNFQGLFDLIKKNTQENNAWSAAQAQKQMDFQTQANQIAMDFSASEAAKNRDWQEMMSNTAHQREIADLKAAGLNPVLSATGGNGAAVTSGSAASGVTSSGSQADADQSANTALAAIYGSLINAQTAMYNANLSAKTNLQMQQMQTEAQMYGSQLAAEASKYAAGTSYAAQAYSADMSYKNNKEQRTWNAEHPNNGWQAAFDFISGLLSDEGNKGSANDGFLAKQGKKLRDEMMDDNSWLNRNPITGKKGFG